MLKKIFYPFIVCFAFSCTSVKKYNYSINVEKHSVEDLKADINLTSQVLKDGHPGLYWYITKKELDYKFDSLKNSIKSPLTTAEFYQKLAPVIAAIKCGHTALKYPSMSFENKKAKADYTSKVAPLNQFTYAIQDHKLFILSNKSAQKEPKSGAELIEIEGMPTGEIITQLEAGLSYDGYNIASRDKRLERVFSQLYKVYFPQKDSLLVKYKLENDSIQQTFIKIFDKKKNASKIKDSVAKKPVEIVKKSKKPKYRGKPENGETLLDFKFLDEKKSYAYLKVKSFSIPTANFELFFKECFDSLKYAGAKNLIIDLRNNGGGSLKASIELFSYLTDKNFTYLDKPIAAGVFNRKKYGNTWQKINYYLTGFNDKDVIKQDEEGNYYSFMQGYKPQKAKANNFKGKIYVLINEYTFSAASLISANLKGINRATFIGKETGGGFNQCTAGILPVIELKHTKLALRFGLYKMAPVYKDKIYGRGVFPDIELTSSVKDKVIGYDRELQWILNESKTKE